jgi:hypothetical protein
MDAFAWLPVGTVSLGPTSPGRACPGARTAGAQTDALKQSLSTFTASSQPSFPRRTSSLTVTTSSRCWPRATQRCTWSADTHRCTSHLALSCLALRQGLTCCLHVSCESLQAPAQRRPKPSRGTPSLARGGGLSISYHGGPQQRACCPIHRHRGKPLQNLPTAMLCRSIHADGQSPRNGLCSVQTPMQVPICTTAHQSKHCRHGPRCAVICRRCETAATLAARLQQLHAGAGTVCF